MKIDINTLAIISSIMNLLQFTALFVQWRLEKNRHGLGWWTLGIASSGLGYAFLYLRAFPQLTSIAIMANNLLFISSQVFIYIGFLRFFNRRERRAPLILFLVVFTLADIYFTSINDNFVMRRAVLYLSGAGLMFIAARAILRFRSDAVRGASSLLVAVSLIFGSVMILSTLFEFLNPPGEGLLSASASQVMALLGGLIGSTLNTFGYILLVNQRLEAERRQASENQELIFNTTPDAVVITRLSDGLIVEINDSFTYLTGFTHVDVFGKSSLEIHLLQNPDDRALVTATLAEKGVCDNLEIIFQRKDGSPFAGLLSARVFSLQGVAHIISVTRDITERQRVEAELVAAHAELEQRVFERTRDLQMANAALEKASRSKDDFLAIISHELRTPLTGILGLAQVLQYSTYGEMNPKQTTAVQNIEKSGQLLLELINEILDFSKLQSGQLTLQLAPCSLAAVCTASLEMVNHLAEKKKQDLRFSIQPEKIMLNADERRVRQILINLLSNAVKFTPEAGRIELVVTGIPQAGQVRITITDTGIGIREEDLQRLFLPFQQLDTRLSRMYNGTGLGLSLVKNLAELHGGSVEVASIFGQGSRFMVSLPWDAKTLP